MSIPKVPNQFPWIVVAVVVVHGMLAIFLFGSRAGSESTAALPEPVSELDHDHDHEDHASPAGPASEEHPLGKPVPKATTYGKADNEDFEPRFPRRIPLQSELTGETPASPKPEPEPDVFAMAEEVSENPKAEREKAAGLLSIPSAVAAARAAPFSASDPESLDEPAVASNLEVGNRLRIIERVEPIPVPQPRPVTKPETPAAVKTIPPIERVVSSDPKPVVRALPVVTKPLPKVEAVEPAAVKKLPPVSPSRERKFRVVKPLAR